MSRARITALVLVNWKGVFYERYLLDRHVTALEGANGAGKTTVMIAAYVALLPDLSKLRFTNLGETAATGGDRGIWGRLGELGRPSYTVLELDAGGVRVLAGVRLARMTEPTVEPTTFLVTNLPAEARLSDLLLHRQLDGDHIPELEQVRLAVERAGGTFEQFRAVKDYFAALFERGITPMRLVSDEDRTKLNEMLRTSMTGGISRALTSELRAFVLKEETGLGDTLARMRANLEACARTRTEVGESRQLEREISAIYEAGAEMFAAAVHAARSAAAEAEHDIEVARPRVEDAVRAHAELTERIAQLEAAHRNRAERLAAARSELAQAHTVRERAAIAATLQTRLGELEAELAGLTQAEQAARATQTAATAARMTARDERTRALAAVDRAAHGLADLQRGLDELARRAHGYRELGRRLDEARRLLGRPDLTAADAPAAIIAVDLEHEALAVARTRLERSRRDIAVRRAEHAEAVAALVQLDPAAADAPSATLHGRARGALARLAEREGTGDRRHELEQALEEATVLAARQAVARTVAASLGFATATTSHPPDITTALASAEQELRASEAALEAERAESTMARARELELRGALADLDDRGARWGVAMALALRLAPAAEGTPPGSRAELAAVRDRLAQAQHAVAAEQTARAAARAAQQERATALERSGTHVDPTLLALRDQLGGELLASRFEDLDVAAASWVEARLGPLANAIIVDDLDAAVAAVEGADRVGTSVWLVAATAALSVDPPEDLAALADVEDVVVVEPFGARVTRRVPRPTLGRRAREKQVQELYAAIDRDGAALDELAARANQLAGWRRDVEQLEPHADLLGVADPGAVREALRSELAGLELAALARTSTARAARKAGAALRERIDGLRRLLPDLALLTGPDHAARAAALAAQHAGLAALAAELAQVAPARALLAEQLDALRQPPPDDAALAAGDAQLVAHAARLDALALAREALAAILLHRHAADDADAEAALVAGADLAPALEAQHADARAAVQAAADAESIVESAWEVATAAAQQADAARLAALAHRDRAATDLAAVGALPPAASLPEPAALQRIVETLDAEARELVTQRALAGERLERAAADVTAARAALVGATRDAGPAAGAWAELRDRAQTEALLHGVLAAARVERSSVQLAADAWSKKDLLLDRVARARGGEELGTALRDHALDGVGYLASWLAVRDWLRRRVPAQVAADAEPLAALERLRDHLDVLEGRLRRQEHDLRGASEDVARGIDVQVRRAHGQVRRLNQQLEGIRFGSIHGIRVEIRRIERMDAVLRALRLGEAQELLFMTSIPIEEALDEIFRRYGGAGRGGGYKLLDYREYVELVVEIKRQSADGWEVASPTKLSTGEAIGVGAAMMMVVLTEWERDANLLRTRRTGGSLRFLFLDEANRLSRDNLGVLFDLCKTLDLQLLIAAPEVARAEGNTTYRLVRHVTDAGHEEVIVSGRRATPGLAEPPQ